MKFLHDRPWIPPIIKSLDIDIHVMAAQLSGHCDITSNRLTSEKRASETRGRFVKIVFLSSFMDSLCCARNRITHRLSWRTVFLPLEFYFGIFFPRCFVTREINNKITLSWALNRFVTRLHTLFSISTGIIKYLGHIAPFVNCITSKVNTLIWFCRTVGSQPKFGLWYERLLFIMLFGKCLSYTIGQLAGLPNHIYGCHIIPCLFGGRTAAGLLQAQSDRDTCLDNGKIRLSYNLETVGHDEFTIFYTRAFVSNNCKTPFSLIALSIFVLQSTTWMLLRNCIFHRFAMFFVSWQTI